MRADALRRWTQGASVVHESVGTEAKKGFFAGEGPDTGTTEAVTSG